MSSFVRPLCLILAVAVRPAICQTVEVRFANEACHVASPCSFNLRPRNWRQLLIANDSVDLFTISVRGSSHDVWSQASESGFEHRDWGWIVLGREGMAAPADTTTGPGWRGVRGTVLATLRLGP